MAAPKKRLGKGKNRLKFEDVSPRAEKEEQEMLDKKMYGGKMKKPVAMKEGGKLRMVNKNGEQVPFFAADGVGKMAYGGKTKKMRDGGGVCRGMGAATKGGNYKMG